MVTKTFRALVIGAALPLSLVAAPQASAGTGMPDQHGTHGALPSLQSFGTVGDGGGNWRWE